VSNHHDLAQPLQHALDWLHGNAGATVQHAAQALGHSEARVKEMLDHLVERGLVHRTNHETGDAHHRASPGRAPAKHNVWESPRRTPRHNRARGAR
jgi:predicted ArsR family transcriptional regulator